MLNSLPGVVISVRNDAQALTRTLPELTACFEEIVIVDNHSSDECQQVCRQFSVKRIEVPAEVFFSRGQCWNTGAAHIQAESVLFLPADTLISAQAVEALRSLWREVRCDYSCFRIRFPENSWKFRLLEKFSNARSRYLKIIYGDQGLCVRRHVFEAIGGFPQEYILEDLKINHFLKPFSFRFINAPIFPSSRKFHQLGFYRYLWLMNKVLLLNFLGMSSKKIYQLYYSRPL